MAFKTTKQAVMVKITERKLQMTNRKRYIIVMFFSVMLNEALYLFASSFNLPVWLDFGGTLLSAVMLEPAAGIIVGFANNFFLSVKNGDSTMIIYFIASAASAVIAGLMIRKNGKIKISRIP